MKPLAFIMSLFFCSSSFAMDPAAHSPLESCMKQMDQHLKNISRQVHDSSLNQKTAEWAAKLSQITTQCKSHIPRDLNRLPDNERDTRKALYEEMMEHTAELSDQLTVSLRNNDNIKAQKLVKNLIEMKRDGHDEFKRGDFTLMAYDLKSLMKQMGTNLKLIANRINDPSQNSNSANLADEMAQATLESKKHLPGSISSLPASEQAARKEQYDKMLDDSARLSQELAAALRANDNLRVKAIIDQLGNLKRDGHIEFK